MIYDFLYENLNFLYGNLNFLYENLRFSLRKIWMIFYMIFSTIHKISYYKVRVPCSHHQTTGPFQKSGWVGSGHLSYNTAVWAGTAHFFFATIRVEPHQPHFVHQKCELSRFNPNFSWKNSSWFGSTRIFFKILGWAGSTQIFFQKLQLSRLNSVFNSKFGLSLLDSKFFPMVRICTQICFWRFWPLLSWAGSIRIFNIWV